MFVTVKDETGDAQLIVWLHVFRESRRDPRNLVMQARPFHCPRQHRRLRRAEYPPPRLHPRRSRLAFGDGPLTNFCDI